MRFVHLSCQLFLLVCLFFTISIVHAGNETPDQYEVYTSTDDDFYLDMEGKVILIASEIIIPIILNPTLPDINISNGDNQVTQLTGNFDKSGWTNLGYEILQGDFEGSSDDDLFLSSHDPYYPSFFLVDAYTENAYFVYFGFDWGADVRIVSLGGKSYIQNTINQLYADINSKYYVNPLAAVISGPAPDTTVENSTATSDSLITDPVAFDSSMGTSQQVALSSVVATRTVTAAGKTPGSFNVTKNGALTYSLPLDLPPGIAGHKPSVALSYSSQAGYGLVGKGWGLSSYPIISRCGNKKILGDAYNQGTTGTDSDQLCLGGQRLVLDAGTHMSNGATYRTLLDTYSKTTYINASQIRVQTKSGSTVNYALKTSDLIWYPETVSDQYDNLISFVYSLQGTTGAYQVQLDEINYASVKVEFSYDEAINTGAYRAGTFTGIENLTTGISILVGHGGQAQTVRQYELKYNTLDNLPGRNVLASIQECRELGESTSDDCKASTQFLWNQDSIGFAKTGAEFTRQVYEYSDHYESIGLNDGEGLATTRKLDWNGDGIQDLLTMSAGGRVIINLGNKTGVFTQVNLLPNLAEPVKLLSAAADSNGDLDYRETTDARVGLTVADINSDGLDDLIYAHLTFYSNVYSLQWCGGEYCSTNKFDQYGEPARRNSYDISWRVVLSDGSQGVERELSALDNAGADSHFLKQDDLKGLTNTFLDSNYDIIVNPVWNQLASNLSFGPKVVDFDNDGQKEIIFPLQTDIVWQAIPIFDGNVYHITNPVGTQPLNPVFPSTPNLYRYWNSQANEAWHIPTYESDWVIYEVVSEPGSSANDLRITEGIGLDLQASTVVQLFPEDCNGVIQTEVSPLSECQGSIDEGEIAAAEFEPTAADTPLVLDSNLDGRDELFIFGKGELLLVSLGLDGEFQYDKIESLSIERPGLYQSADSRLIFWDYNGDGLKDFVLMDFEADTATLFQNTGADNLQNRWIDKGDKTTELYSILSSDHVVIEDFNRDGRDDVLYSDGSGSNVPLKLLFSTGDGSLSDPGLNNNLVGSMAHIYGSIAAVPAGEGFSVVNDGLFDFVVGFLENTNPMLQTGDYNGDGSIDLIKVGSSMVEDEDGEEILASYNSTWQFYANTMNRSTAVGKIIDGLGNETEISYKPLADSLVHTPSTGSEFPIKDLASGMHVVNEIKTSDGVGGQATTRYQYEGAKTHAQGLGFLGFSKVTTTNHRTGSVGVKEYAQDTESWQLLGRLNKQTTTLNGKLQQVSENDWLSPEALAGKTYSPYLDQSYTVNYETNGNVSSVSTLDQAINTSNGVISSSETINGLGSSAGVISQWASKVKTEFSDFDESISEWLVGFPQNKKVTSSRRYTGINGAQVSSSKVVETGYTRKTGKLSVETETAFPDDAALTSVLTYGYDTEGNVTSTTINGNTNFVARSTSASLPDADMQFYGTFNNELSQAQTSRVYDKRFGSLTSMTDIDGLSVSSTYDTYGRLTQSVSKDGSVTSTTYSLCNNCIPSALSSLDLTVSNKVTTTVTHPNSVSLYPEQTNRKGAPTSSSYLDSFGREVLTETVDLTGNAIYTVTVYDKVGRTQKVSQPFKLVSAIQWTEYKSYDEFNRPNKILYPEMVASVASSRPKTSFTYTGQSSGGLKTTVLRTIIEQDRNGAITSHGNKTETYNNTLGQVSSKTEAAESAKSITTTYGYDEYGNMEAARVNGNAATDVSWTYDKANRLVSHIDPDAGSITNTYDALGNVLTTTDAKNQITRVSYDAGNRLEKRWDLFQGNTGVTPTTQWFYDNDTECSGAATHTGTICKVKHTDFYETYGYDNLGRLANTSSFIKQTNNTYKQFDLIQLYDEFSRPEALEYPNNYQTANAYSATGYMSSVSDVASSKVLKSYDAMDAFGNFTSYQIGDQVDTHDSYHPSYGFLSSRKTGKHNGSNFTTELQDANYYWYSNGNLQGRNNQTFSRNSIETFEYDELYRLSLHQTDDSSEIFVYDLLGNLMTKPGVSALEYKQSGSAGPHAVTSANGKSYTYDANGNVTNRAGYNITYTSFDKPSSIASAKGTSEFKYGPSRLRFEQKVNGETTYYIGGVYEEVKASNGTITKKNFVGDFLQRTDVGGSVDFRYLHRDHLGSVDVMSNASGNETTHFEYGVFGEQLSGNANLSSRGFTDHEHLDESGLIHMNGRIYDPILGRFMSADIVIQNPYNSQSFNRYSYVLNNPLSLTDPTGYMFEDFGFFDWALDWAVDWSMDWATNFVYDTIGWAGQEFNEWREGDTLGASFYDLNVAVAGELAVSPFQDSLDGMYAFKSDDFVAAGFVGAGIVLDRFGGKLIPEVNYAYFNKTHIDSLPKPKGRGPNDGRLQSHHGLQQQWAKENLKEYGYDANLAPSVTLETGKGLPHTLISNSQNLRRNARVASGDGKWSSSLQDELNYIVGDMGTAGFQKQTINQVLGQQYKMLDKLNVPYQKLNN